MPACIQQWTKPQFAPGRTPPRTTPGFYCQSLAIVRSRGRDKRKASSNPECLISGSPAPLPQASPRTG
jgi:hypothetical protein